MRIVNIMLGKKRGGLEQVAYDYHFHLAQRGHQILTILRKGAEFDVSALDPNQVVYTEPSKLPFLTERNLKNLILQFQADIVLAHGKRPLYYVKSMKLDCPRVFVAHNYRSKSSCKKMDAAIAVSASVKDHLLSLGMADEKCHIIHNMTDMKNVNSTADLKNPALFGLLSRLHPNKGVDIFIKALRVIRDQNINAHAIIAGSGPQEQALKQLTNELKLNDHISFLGWVSDKTQFYKDIDIFIMPSRVEPFGITAIETIAAGCPMIVSDCAGPVSFIEDGKEAYIVPKENVQELAAAMTNLLSDQRLRDDMLYHQAISAKNFTPDTIITNVENSLEYFAKQYAKPSSS